MTQLSDSDALRAFLACSDGDLCERARLWILETLKILTQIFFLNFF